MTDEQIYVTVKFFAAPREALDVDEVEMELPDGVTVDDLLDHLTDAYPVLEAYLPSLSVAVNRRYVDRQTVLHAGDEVACLPPVAGG
jgi:molybdopterin converting factor subunit 1